MKRMRGERGRWEKRSMGGGEVYERGEGKMREEEYRGAMRGGRRGVGGVY